MVGFLLATTAVVTLLLLAWGLLRIAGSRSAWVVLGDSTSDSVILIRAPASFRESVRCPPSALWATYWQLQGVVAVNPEATVPALCAMWRTSQTNSLPNGTRAEVVDRLLLSERDLEAHILGIMGSSHDNRNVEVVRVRVRAGPHAGLEAWTLPCLMQHEIVWP